MVRSRLPLPSLLGVLLMLPGLPTDKPNTDPYMSEALVAAVKKYNERSDSANYYKVLCLLKTQHEVFGFHIQHIQHLLVELVETRCKKEAGTKMPFMNIQKCQLLPGNPEKPICYFKVIYLAPLFQMKLDTSVCS